MNNTSEVIKHLHSEIVVKAKQQKLFKLLKFISFKNEYVDASKTNSAIKVTKYFYNWLNLIINEKKSLIQDINSYSELNVNLINII